VNSKSSRGELYVLVQAILLIALFFGPKDLLGSPTKVNQGLWLAGQILFYLGIVIAIWAAILLGPNLTPLPKPKPSGQLIQTGLYKLVRHPIYFGVILVSFGWAGIEQTIYTLVLACILLIFFDLKSRQEERWLTQKFSEYAEYKMTTKKLIPFVY
jgi:protein-S-isoprenylcysteine O-methyltransferase Ste14